MSYTRTNGRAYVAPAGIESGLRMSAEATDRDYALTLKDVLQVIGRRIWVVLLVATACVGVAVGASLVQTPMYQASITILVGQGRGITDTPTDVAGLQQLTITMAEAVGSRPIAEKVIQQQGLQTDPDAFLSERLKVEQVSSTQFIGVDYTDSEPERAQRVANAVGEVFSERISSNTDSITATVWEPAVTPTEPDPLRNGLLALILGLMLGVGLAALLEYFDESWRSPEEVEQLSGIPTYGIIPTFDIPSAKKKKS